MRKIVLMDGAVGTSLWEKAKDKKPVWRYNMENPEIVKELAEAYVRAGAEIVLANTFAANRGNLRDSGYSVREVVARAVEIAKTAVAGRAKIALSIGPLSELLEPYGDLPAADAREMLAEMIEAGAAAGADLIFLQTFMDLEMMKLGLEAAQPYGLPVFCAFSLDQKGRTMMGNSVEQIVEELAPYAIDALGLNCSLGPELAVPVIARFRALTDRPLIFKPNAGKPGRAGAEFDAETFAKDAVQALDCGVTYIGGCCGTNPRYIEKLAEAIGARA